jgi:transposase
LADFQACQAAVEELKRREQASEIALWFSDETSFSLNPVSMYAWQPQKKGLVLPAERKKVSNVLGFIKGDNSSEFYSFTGNMTSELWVKTVDNFIEEQGIQAIPTYIVVDRASTHTAKLVKSNTEKWAAKNIFIHYLNAYCSELNPIEIVWRFMKHHWLSVRDYLSRETLEKAVNNLCDKFGKEYFINFKLQSK